MEVFASRPATGLTTASASAIAASSRDSSGSGCIAATPAIAAVQVGAAAPPRGEHGARDFDADARADAHASTDEPHLSVGRLAKGDSPQMFRNPRQHHRFVCRCDRIAPGSREQRGFLVGDIVERAETFAVLEIDVEDHCDVWLDDSRQFWNLAARVGAAFQYGRSMLAGECENRHRYADQIIEITRG